MKLAGALHHRKSPAGRGLRAVDNATSYTRHRLLKLYVAIDTWRRTKSLQCRLSIRDCLHLLLASSLH